MGGNVVIFGPSGLVGGAALRHFDALPDWNVTALSRRPPAFQHGANFIPLDLMNRNACEDVLRQLSGTTHIIYTSLYEQQDVIRGWRAQEQMETNTTMLRNALEPLDAAAGNLSHISLFQGTKAYGAHLRPPPVPARERWERNDHQNFYWYQEDFGDSEDGVLKFVARFSSSDDRAFLRAEGVRIEYLEYDWRLNSQ